VKFVKIFTGSLGCLFLIWVFLTNPFKITDPNHSWFNPMSFKFSDYKTREAKKDAFKKLFPVGITKDYIDEVLVKTAGAKSVTASKDLPTVWIYSEPNTFGYPPGPAHTFIFNNNDQLENIMAFNIDYLYPNQITKEDLRNVNPHKE
jgi:hypothetical protein